MTTSTLLERLTQENFNKLNESENNLKDYTMEILEDKFFYTDLTIEECDSICMVILDEGFYTTSQVFKLFKE
jgi:hypothetical protein